MQGSSNGAENMGNIGNDPKGLHVHFNNQCKGKNWSSGEAEAGPIQLLEAAQ